ncbi:hypothetical protein TWF730_003638 [Orbilia blumenaviensis]|uniref:Uncharacterized protein n=1 Tax=Orbilia blumenaviensis TaxID=1796055 RepID=A0AAV9U5W8_9PEZI
MCWTIMIGTCGHPEPTPDLTTNPTPCTCNRYTTAWLSTKCSPCIIFITQSAITQNEFIDLQYLNRNITYFLQATNAFGRRCEEIPGDIEEWVNLPNVTGFTVNEHGNLFERGRFTVSRQDLERSGSPVFDQENVENNVQRLSNIAEGDEEGGRSLEG